MGHGHRRLQTPNLLGGVKSRKVRAIPWRSFGKANNAKEGGKTGEGSGTCSQKRISQLGDKLKERTWLSNWS